MIIKTYYQAGACKPLWNQNCIVGGDGSYKGLPIMYLQRPKWITDDARWDILCKSIRLDLPMGFELK